MERKLVKITWLDANRGDGWQMLKDIPHVVKCITVGHVLDENPQEIVVAGTVTADGDVGEVIAIPKGMVQKREDIALVYPT